MIGLTALIVLIVTTISLIKDKRSRKPLGHKKTLHKGVRSVGGVYDSGGYDANGYTAFSRDRLGRYNRLLDRSCDDGFLPVRLYPVKTSPHSRKRIEERMGITEDKINKLVLDAYRFGKSKR